MEPLAVTPPSFITVDLPASVAFAVVGVLALLGAVVTLETAAWAILSLARSVLDRLWRPHSLRRTSIRRDDPGYARAVAQAQATLPRFRELCEESGIERGHASVLVPMCHPGRMDLVWYPVRWLSREICRVRVGPRTSRQFMEIPVSEIADWTVATPGGAVRGGYTYAVLAIRTAQRHKKLPRGFEAWLGRLSDVTDGFIRSLRETEVAPPKRERLAPVTCFPQPFAGRRN